MSQKDIDEKIESVARSTNRPPEEIKEYYKKQNLLEGLGEDIKEEKVLDLLLKEANIVDEK